MFVLGHLGIGSALGKPWVKAQQLRWLLVGTLLPDLIDKPLYYGLAFVTGRHAAALGLISSTRTIGHTLLLVGILRVIFGKERGSALALGMLTHLGLDELGDLASLAGSFLGLAGPAHTGPGPSTLAAIFFPLLGPHFPISPFGSLSEHLFSLARAWTLASEVLGLLLLWRNRRWLRGALD